MAGKRERERDGQSPQLKKSKPENDAPARVAFSLNRKSQNPPKQSKKIAKAMDISSESTPSDPTSSHSDSSDDSISSASAEPRVPTRSEALRAAEQARQFLESNGISPVAINLDTLHSDLKKVAENVGLLLQHLQFKGHSTKAVNIQVFAAYSRTDDEKGAAQMQPVNGNGPTRNEAGVMSQSLPQPPLIRNPDLAKLPFIHSSQTSDSTKNYEQLEFLGDAILQYLASSVIFKRFPQKGPGEMSTLRQSLVRNQTFASFARKYQFDKRLRCTGQEKESPGFTKILGDVFEAYVAAVYLSYEDREEGLRKVEAWVIPLWKKTLDVAARAPPPASKTDAKQDLARMLVAGDVRIEYRDMRPGFENKRQGRMNYYVGAYFTGWGYHNLLLGRAQGPSKKEAGFRAAKDAQEHNKKLLDDLAQKKLDFVARRMEQQIDSEAKGSKED